MIGKRKQHPENTSYCLFWSKLPFFSEQCSILRTTYRLPGGHSGKESTCQCRRWGRYKFNPWVMKIPWRRKWKPTLVFLPREFHRQKSLTGYSPWGHKELDTVEHTHTHRHKNSLGWGSNTPNMFMLRVAFSSRLSDIDGKLALCWE